MRWAILLAFGSSAAIADTGYSLQQKCKKEKDDTAHAYCIGVLAGVAQTINCWRVQNSLSADPPNYCLPDNATNGQMFQVFMKYLNENPPKLHMSAAVLVGEAFESAFPCPKK